jgi:O-antigen ligase
VPPSSRETPAGWTLLAALLLLPPLIQGGTPRLPTLAVQAGICALAVHWAWSWARAPRRGLRVTAIDALVGALLFWALFSLPFAPYYHAAEAAALAIACYALLYGYLVAHPSLSGLATGLAAVRAQAALQSALVLWQAFGAGKERPAGTFFNPNFLAGFLAVALLLIVGAEVFPAPGAPRRPARRALAAAEGALALAGLLLTSSRGGALALAAGLLVLLGLRSWRLTAAATVVGGLAIAVTPNPLRERLATLQLDAFAWTRIDIWKSAAAMMRDHPWLGVGLGQFEFFSPRYAFPISTHWAKYTRTAENAHSEYLQAGAELGVPGLLLALALAAALLAAAAWHLHKLQPAARGPVATLLAGCVAIGVHAVVDFPLHAPPTALALVLLAAGLRAHGAGGAGIAAEFRVRPSYAAVAALVALAMAGAAVRPVVGFWYFLGGLGAPRNLLNEKWALEEAPRRQLPPAEAARLVGLASRVDPANAPYHRALGSALFQAYLRGEAGEGALQAALYHLSYASELNPNQVQYALNSAQAMIALARHSPPGRDRLKEGLGYLKRAVQLAPYQHKIYTEFGALEDELGDTAAAERAFRRAVSLEKYFLRGWYNLGAFYARHERYDEARKAFNRGAELAAEAASLVPTSPEERELIAVKPEFFYNELRKIDMVEYPGGRPG